VREDIKIGIVFEEVTVDGEEMEMAARIVVKTRLPEQNERLPHILEESKVKAGHEFMREFYRQAIERADLELVLSKRAGKDGAGIQRIGRRPYRFKTRFGTVPVKRIRIKHKADKSTEIPSSLAWDTGRQLCITEGLKNAVCNLVVKQSFSRTVRELEVASGEQKLLSKSSIGKILHETGEQLAEAQNKRAEQVYDQDNEAKRVLGRAETYIAEEFFEQVCTSGRRE